MQTTQFLLECRNKTLPQNQCPTAQNMEKGAMSSCPVCHLSLSVARLCFCLAFMTFQDKLKDSNAVDLKLWIVTLLGVHRSYILHIRHLYYDF